MRYFFCLKEENDFSQVLPLSAIWPDSPKKTLVTEDEFKSFCTEGVFLWAFKSRQPLPKYWYVSDRVGTVVIYQLEENLAKSWSDDWADQEAIIGRLNLQATELLANLQREVQCVQTT